MTKNAKNYISGALVKISILLSQLVLVPIFIHSLGVQQYGEWILITTIPNYLLLSDLGLTQTVTNEICRLIALGRVSEQRDLFRSTNSMLLCIGVGLVFILFVVSFSFDFENIFGLEIVSNRQCFLIIFLFTINVVVSLILRLILGYFKAFGEFYKHEFVLAFVYIFDFFMSFVVLFFSMDLFFIPLFYVVVRVLVLFFIHLYLTPNSYYSYSFTSDLTLSARMLPVSIKLSFFSLGYALLLQGTTFVVGVGLGSSAVVIFNTVRTLVNSIKAGVSVIYLPSMPDFSVMISKVDYHGAYIKLVSLVKKVFLLSCLVSMFIFIFRDNIFRFWLGYELEYSYMFIAFMLFSIVIQNIWNAISMLPLAINRLNELSFFPVICFLVLVVQYYWIGQFSLDGIAIGLVFIDLLMLFVVTFVSSRILRVGIIEVLKRNF